MGFRSHNAGNNALNEEIEEEQRKKAELAAKLAAEQKEAARGSSGAGGFAGQPQVSSTLGGQ